jgi:hypothetical protein
MKVEIEMEIGEADESAVMEKVSRLTREAKELGFTIEEIELKQKKEEDEEKEEKHKSKRRKRR